ncbi:hypothetical protein ACSNOI_10165 [Actinomadura kijaniata]|uniref:hypothetical protein n=1 Tax=Actinomadura kijaniata TaxID=46161 RepID=UPI003F1DA184
MTSSTNGKVATMTYGANGGESLTAAFQPSTPTDAQGNTTAYTYNGPGNLQAAKNALVAQADADYNDDGTVKTAADPENRESNNSTKYAYTHRQFTSLTPVTSGSL